MTGSPAVISVGRLVDGKDPITALRAFLGFAAGAPGAELWWIYHDDRLEPRLLAELDVNPALASRVHLVGRVDRAAMGAWLSGADVFLSASRHEGSGYALIEAIRCGCTPVVSNIAPHRAIAGPLGPRFPRPAMSHRRPRRSALWRSIAMRRWRGSTRTSPGTRWRSRALPRITPRRDRIAPAAATRAVARRHRRPVLRRPCATRRPAPSPSIDAHNSYVPVPSGRASMRHRTTCP